MKKLLFCLMLAISINRTSYAQEGRNTNSDRIFEINPDYFQRRFLIDLGKGNKLQIELSNIADIDRMGNPDSLLRIFLNDILPLKDSLADELTSKRIDCVIDSAGRKTIRIQQFKPKGSSFIIGQAEVAALKLEQDTVNFNTTYSYTAKYTMRRGFTATGHYRMSFFVNQLSDLNNYTDGRLNDKLNVLKKSIDSSWVGSKSKRAYLKADPAISSMRPKGYFSSPGLYFHLNFAISLHNYKNYFVPSSNLGGVFILSNSFFKREIGIFWEPNFFFAKNSQGSLQTFRNDFIMITLGHGGVKDNDPQKESYLITILSYAYLVNRQGDFFARHTSRLGGGRLSLFEGKTMIEPAIYFNDFFKGVTPTVRLTQRF